MGKRSPQSRYVARIEAMPLNRQEALDYFHSPDLIGLGLEADAVRRRLHPEGVVTYIIDRNINYTNFCTEYCTFCAFYRPLNGARSEEGYILDFDTIYDKIAETLEMGGTGVLMQGGIHPDLKIDWFERLFSGIKQRFPQIWLHCLTASEILAIAKYSGLPLRETIVRLRQQVADREIGGAGVIRVHMANRVVVGYVAAHHEGDWRAGAVGRVVGDDDAAPDAERVRRVVAVASRHVQQCNSGGARVCGGARFAALQSHNRSGRQGRASHL